MNITLSSASLLIHSFGWALIYSLWQGLLIYGALSILLKLLPDANARTKYYISSAGLLGLSGWFAGMWYSQWQTLKGVTVFVTQEGTGILASKTYAIHTIPQEAMHNGWLNALLYQLEQYMPYIVSLYIAGLLLMAIRFAINLRQVTMLRTHGISAPEQGWSNYVQQWKKHFNILRPVALYLSDRVTMPMMMGILRPVILIPVATINHLSAEQLEAILLHELAHIKRHDYLLNILQTVVETILFFNPFAWLISSLIRREREHCCDDLVVAHTHTPLPYAHALALLETNRNHLLAMAATGRKQHLFNRIKRIMEMKKNSVNYSQLVLIVLGVAAITIAVACFSPSFAQKTKTSSKDSTGRKNSSVYTETYATDKDGNTKKEVTRETQMGDKNDNDDADMDMAFGDDDSMNVSKIIKMSMRMVDSSLQTVDWKQIDKEMADAKKEADNIDWKSINKEIADAKKEVDNIDWKSVNKEIADAQKEIDNIDWKKIQKDVDKGMKEMNDPKVRREVEKAMADAKREVAMARVEVMKAQNQQREEMEDLPALPEHPAKKINDGNKNVVSVHLTSADKMHDGDGKPVLEDMLSDMQREGLINRSKKFTVKKDKGIIIINGVKQPASVSEKYADKMLYKSIAGDSDGLTIEL